MDLSSSTTPTVSFGVGGVYPVGTLKSGSLKETSLGARCGASTSISDYSTTFTYWGAIGTGTQYLSLIVQPTSAGTTLYAISRVSIKTWTLAATPGPFMFDFYKSSGPKWETSSGSSVTT